MNTGPKIDSNTNTKQKLHQISLLDLSIAAKFILITLCMSTFTNLQPLGEEVFVQQGHQAGGGQHAFPIHDPVEGLHLLLVRINNQLSQAQSCGGKQRSPQRGERTEE